LQILGDKKPHSKMRAFVRSSGLTQEKLCRHFHIATLDDVDFARVKEKLEALLELF